MAEAFNDNDAIPGSVQLLDVFLQDMNALDILQSTESPSKHQSQAATSDSVQTKPVDPAANLLQFPSVQVRSPGKLWPKKKNQTWLRRKEELNRLRQQTEQMETHIAFLLLKREKRWRLPLDSVKEMQWKAAERKLLQNVLRENAILKSQVPAQIQVLTGLQAAVSAVRTPPSPPRATVKGQQLQINTSIFSMLETRVDQRFQDVHRLLNQLQVSSTAVDAVEVQMCRGEDGTSAAMEYKVFKFCLWMTWLRRLRSGILSTWVECRRRSRRLYDVQRTRTWSSRASCYAGIKIHIYWLMPTP
ncbi:hypothetical protein PC129_g16649 [Phytophthora cactorum]|uniref:Uncharacterized protein n=1 Tax=Phytophthora cactorum TaxID=29920 RepID=A0A8T1KMT2_9STRA|nr:hypothetical protein Pcac1_g1332 [Phytophthora cactorum]KAG2809364.1 hypothetical protein PC112_g16536 [Phytophthora cactorum]KAG3019351.1 hypothetical protein PC119_g10331 [Phytophthora cactorum]KAG3158917.1 hypothetical protein C6341_g14267 [Phytophthora cactorum]KAG3212396.1 hypothetical protein PC129_g16649 [Phytophthora cactorum]